MKILVVLQNAYADEEAEHWKREDWMAALQASRSGRRLSRLFSDWGYASFINTTPKVGKGPGSKLPVDEEYLRMQLEVNRPCLVVAMGLQAEGVMRRLWSGSLLCLPHPAARLLTNSLIDRAKDLLFGYESFQARLAIRQTKSGVSLVMLPSV